jgi:parvulin-like peptidyl-prolyl isomerase
MKFIKGLIASALAFCMSVALFACDAGGDTVASTVNGEKIMESTITSKIMTIRQSSESYATDEGWATALQQADLTPEELRKQQIENEQGIILMRQACAEKGLTVDASAIDASIAEARGIVGGDDAQWQEALKKYGYVDENAYRLTLENAELEKKLQESLVTDPTDEELSEYIQQYAMYLSGRRSAAITLLPAEGETLEELSAKAAEIVQQLNDGADFAQMVKEHSTDEESKENGGDKGWSCLINISTAYKEALDQLEQDQISEPVIDSESNCVYIIKCTGIYLVPQEVIDAQNEAAAKAAAEAAAANDSSTTDDTATDNDSSDVASEENNAATSDATSDSTNAADTAAAADSADATSGTDSDAKTDSATDSAATEDDEAEAPKLDIKTVPSEILEQVKTMYSSQSASSKLTEFMEQLKEGADIVINDMPSGLPYDVDMSLAASSDSSDTNVDSSTATDTEEETPANNLPPMPAIDPSEITGSLVIVDTEIGSGAEAKVGDSITVKYTGYFVSGTVFDSTDKYGGEPITFTLSSGGLIEGWIQGIPGMKVGGKRHLVIPSELAYGAAGKGEDIPPNSDLAFEIELVAVNGVGIDGNADASTEAEVSTQ